MTTKSQGDVPSSPSREEALRMFRAGLDKAMQQTAASYAIPICWIRAKDGRPEIVDNGTAFVLNCGAGSFLVTAGHVFQGYVAARAKYPDCVCFLSNMRFDLGSRLIGYDPAYDVATLHLTPEELQSLVGFGKYALTGSQPRWPPKPPTVERGVFFVGFPGDGRSMRPRRANNLVEIDWSGYTALAIANSVSDTGVTVVLNHDPTFDIRHRSTIPPDWALGGCSGAPLLTFIERNGIFSWQLGGIINEATKEIVRASRADCINPDGSINGYPDPMAYRPRDC